ncbi:MAG TPA: hypothetical protein VH331_00880 [Allosphingosinicella sp.]|jgi:hypothetical protein|nr:hypothetical protein [Allosphingosinicella sp.]
MATIATALPLRERPRDVLSGTPRASSIDRWIFVIIAAWFVVVVLAGFIPDSLMKVAAVQAGQRPPFPLVLHMHAVLMGSFMLLLLAQTVLMATGRSNLHMRAGIAAFVLAPTLVAVGLILIPTIYHSIWDFAQTAPPALQAKMHQRVLTLENLMLLQLRIAFLFPLFLFIGLRARAGNAGLHKRMMLLAPAVVLGASIDRMSWLPTTLPTSPLATDLYILIAVSPMFVWDVLRNRRVHAAYGIWLTVNIMAALLVYGLWDRPWWHIMARHIMRV